MSSSLISNDTHLFPAHAHQAVAPSLQTMYRNSISDLWDWEMPLCALYLKLQYVGITVETVKTCQNYGL